MDQASGTLVWFITQKAIRRGSFSNMGELTGQVNAFVEHYNARARPFMWVATAEHPGEDQTPYVNLSPGPYTNPSCG